MSRPLWIRAGTAAQVTAIFVKYTPVAAKNPVKIPVKQAEPGPGGFLIREKSYLCLRHESLPGDNPAVGGAGPLRLFRGAVAVPGIRAGLCAGSYGSVLAPLCPPGMNGML